MATLSGTITAVGQHATNAGPVVNGSSVAVLSCVIAATFSGTYVQADDATITAIPTAIAASRRDGKTVSMVGFCFESPGLEGSTVIGAGLPSSLSSTAAVFPLTGSDLSTEHAGATLSTMTRPIQFRVVYTLA